MAEEEPSAKEIEEKIKKKKLKWKAGTTSISELTPEEKKKRLGLIPTEEEKALIRKKKLEKKKEK